MATNTITWNGHTLTDVNLISATIDEDQALISETLSADAFSFQVLNGGKSYFKTSDNENFITSDGYTFAVGGADFDFSGYKYGDVVTYQHGSGVTRKFYLTEVKRTSKYRYTLTCTSSVGILSKITHKGGIYSNALASTIIADIMSGTSIPYTVDAAVGSTALSGLLPYTDDARENLQQVLFACGASLIKNANGSLSITYNQPETAVVKPKSEIYLGGKENYSAPVTVVDVTEHSFFQGFDTEEEELYTTTDSVTNELIKFEDPVYDLRWTGSTLGSNGATYAYVTGAGTLYGKKYIHSTKVLSESTGVTSTEAKKAAVTDATLVSVLNSGSVLARMVNYYKNAKEIEYDMVVDDERPGDLLNIPAVYENGRTTGFIKEMATDISGINKAKTKLITNWRPSNVGNDYDSYYILTDQPTGDEHEITISGNSFEVPAALQGKSVYVVLFSGGTGGQAGYNGEAGSEGSLDENYNFTAGDGGAGGSGGAGAYPGKKLSGKMTLSASSYAISLGSGGAGGASNGATGSAGEHTTFATLDTDVGGVAIEGSYVNIIDGSVYATIGDDGIGSTARGGHGGDGSSFLSFGTNATEGESFTYNGQTWAGGGTLTEGSHETGVGDGVFRWARHGGGGAAYGKAGNAGWREEYGWAHGGAGASPDAPAQNSYGCGGNGGHGGGGGAASSWSVQIVPQGESSYYWFSYRYAGGGGSGSAGGQGGNGFVLIYYKA